MISSWPPQSFGIYAVFLLLNFLLQLPNFYPVRTSEHQVGYICQQSPFLLWIFKLQGTHPALSPSTPLTASCFPHFLKLTPLLSRTHPSESLNSSHSSRSSRETLSPKFSQIIMLINLYTLSYCRYPIKCCLNSSEDPTIR